MGLQFQVAAIINIETSTRVSPKVLCQRRSRRRKLTPMRKDQVYVTIQVVVAGGHALIGADMLNSSVTQCKPLLLVLHEDFNKSFILNGNEVCPTIAVHIDPIPCMFVSRRLYAIRENLFHETYAIEIEHLPCQSPSARYVEGQAITAKHFSQRNTTGGFH